MKKRITASLLAAAVAAACSSCPGRLIAGCGKEENTSSGGNAKFNKTGYPIVDEKITLNVMGATNSALPEDWNDLVLFKELEKKTNIHLDFKVIDASNYAQQKNLAFASGELPDFFYKGQISTQDELTYGSAGVLTDVSKYFDYMPNLKKAFEDIPELRPSITMSDGKIVSLPEVNDVPRDRAIKLWINKKWLDKLGLEVPKTVEDFHDVLKAFRERDPNGNGIKDEVPYFSRFTRVDDLLNLWGVEKLWAVRDNKVIFFPITEAYRDAYAEIAKWYAEGLIDKEIFTRGSKSRDKLFGDNVGGATHDWFGTTAQFNEVLKDKIPGFELVAFAPPSGVEYYSRTKVNSKGVAFSAKSDKKDVALRFYDFIYSEPGVRLMNFGIEGKHYTMKDGKPYFEDWVLNSDQTTLSLLTQEGVSSAGAGIQDFWYEEQWLNKQAREGARMYLDNNYLAEPFPSLSYTEDEKRELDKIMGNITTLVQESFQKWVFGTDDVMSTHGAFVEKAKSMGIEKAIKIQNDAYKRYKKNTK